MNLPLILDLSIGLIFIYLILSLLSSEIHELITTLLQWRASHLKKSIESLLAGGTTVNESVRKLTDILYDDPLIRSLNQEARGPSESFFRSITKVIAQGYRSVTGLRNPFGNKGSGPSYIPAETFATTLLTTLKLEPLYQKLGENRLQTFIQESIKSPLKEILDSLRDGKADETLLEPEFSAFNSRIDSIFEDFKVRKVDLQKTFDRLITQLQRFQIEAESTFAEPDSVSSIFVKRLTDLRESTFEDEQERTIILNNLRPSLPEVIAEFNKILQVFKLLETYQAVRFAADETGEYDEAILSRLPPEKSQEFLQLRGSFELLKEFSAELKKHGDSYEKVLRRLPPYLQESLPVLAQRAEIKAESIHKGFQQFQFEIESWFDRSMERSSGVYKRNAKGVAIIIGFLIAVAANADTLHIVGRLSRDTILRTAIAESAGRVAPTSNGIVEIRDQVNQALSGVSLPIGWTATNLQQQLEEGSNWSVFAPLRRILGWFLSAIAISMGANFWFGLLNKVINVRNTGSPPPRAADDSATTPK